MDGIEPSSDSNPRVDTAADMAVALQNSNRSDELCRIYSNGPFQEVSASNWYRLAVNFVLVLVLVLMELGSSGIFFSFECFYDGPRIPQGMAVERIERTWSSARGGDRSKRSGILLWLAPCSSHMYI